MSMFVDRIPNRKSPDVILIRESYRENGRSHKRTIANISNLPEEKIEMLSLVLKGVRVAPIDSVFKIEKSTPHGHVEAVLGTIRKLGLETIISSTPSPERDLAIGMIAQRIIKPCSKLATTRAWMDTTLAEEMGVSDEEVADLYDAMDWLLERKEKIENKLARRHLKEGSPVFYDVSSSYYEGRTCPLAFYGHNRDKKEGKKIIVYGLMTDREGRPISIDVYPGNTEDSTTLPDQVEKLITRFHLERVVLVGDRGLLKQTRIDDIKQHHHLGWISALRSTDIKPLLAEGLIQPSLFDETNLAEITSPDYPGERLVACFNPILAAERKRTRDDLLAATEKELTRLEKEVARRTRKRFTDAEIGIKAGRIINKYKMAKHFDVLIEDQRFRWARREDAIRHEELLDGLYVIRTSESAENISKEDVVREYKNLIKAEVAFRNLKGADDLMVRPIRHRDEQRVEAHIFICMLACYVEWHMRQALAPLLFQDEELEENRKKRDPVAQAKPSESVRRKKATRQTEDGLPVHSFRSLINSLGSRCRNTIRMTVGDLEIKKKETTELSMIQSRAFELLGIRVQ